MHSLKNTFVAVVLLGVSYFVYEGITNPGIDTAANPPAGEGLDLEMPEEMGSTNTGSSQGDFNVDRAQTSGDAGFEQPGSFRDHDSGFTTQPSTQFRGSQAPPLLNSAPAVANKGNQFGGFSNDLGSQPTQPETFNSGDFRGATELSPVSPKSFSTGEVTVPATTADSTRGQFGGSEDSGFGGNPSATKTIEATWPQIDQLVQDGKFRSALRVLSGFYGDSNVPFDQQEKLLEWLDALAGKVIYSAEHNLVPSAYVIQANDTLQSISERWNVPAELIYNVNEVKISNPVTLTPGNELKMIRGPFNATLDISDQTLTLFLNNLYAGRFQTTLANGLAPGVYQVSGKAARGGSLGEFQVDLVNAASGTRCSLHAGNPIGSVGLSKDDAEDLFGILGAGSTVKIQQ